MSDKPPLLRPQQPQITTGDLKMFALDQAVRLHIIVGSRIAAEIVSDAAAFYNFLKSPAATLDLPQKTEV